MTNFITKTVNKQPINKLPKETVKPGTVIPNMAHTLLNHKLKKLVASLVNINYTFCKIAFKQTIKIVTKNMEHTTVIIGDGSKLAKLGKRAGKLHKVVNASAIANTKPVKLTHKSPNRPKKNDNMINTSIYSKSCVISKMQVIS